MTRCESLREYQARPTPQALAGLLQARANAIYNLCFQVLRQKQDAEDAAQEVLLKIVEHLRNTPEIRDFERWIYRVTINTSLDRRKRETRRAFYENRWAPLNGTGPEPEGLREAVCEAIALLDDESRRVLVQHFFEGLSLEELSTQRGCSTVAVWKRVERARRALRKALLSLGVSAGAASLDSFLMAIAPVGAPPTLLSTAGAIAASTTTTTMFASGGMVMAGKGVSVAVLAAMCIALFSLGAGGSLALRSSSGSSETSGTTLRSAPAMQALPAPGLATSAPPVAERPESLATQLALVGSLLREAQEAGKQDLERSAQLYERLNELWKTVQPVAFREPTVLFSFLRDRANRDILDRLLSLVMSYTLRPTGSDRSGVPIPPRPVDEGLARMLSEGSRGEKLAIIEGAAADAGGEGWTALADACVGLLLSERDPDLLARMLGYFRPNIYHLGARLQGPEEILRVWRNCDDPSVRGRCLRTLAELEGAAVEKALFEKLGEALQRMNDELAEGVAEALRSKFERSQPEVDERYLPFLTSAMKGTTDQYRLLQFADVAMLLPPRTIASVFQEVRDHRPKSAARVRIERVLQLLRSGETRADVLRAALHEKR